MKLILVRHGQTLANLAGALDTELPGNPLTAEGLAQAQTVPARLEEAGLLDTIGALRVSPILRARQTIAPIERATRLRATIDSGIREVLAGELEMRTDRASVSCYQDTTRAWMTGWPAARLPGSHEDGRGTWERFDAAVRSLAAEAAAAGDGASGLLVSHGTVLRLWTAISAAERAGVDPAWIARHPMGNASISVVEGDPEAGWRLVSWSDGAWTPETGPRA